MSQMSGGDNQTGREYWRSLNEFQDTPEFRDFVYREFPAQATEMLQSDDRRNFLKIMGASMALAGLGTFGGCRRWPDEKIAPFANRPAGLIPGDPEFYATSMELGGVSRPLVATSFDGRPIKVDGNPQHPASGGGGGSDAYCQGSVLDMYDPDRSRFVLNGAERSSWGAFESAAGERMKRLRNAEGQGLAVLCEQTGSPSVLAMKQRLLRMYPEATWHEYEPLNNDNEVQASTAAFGGAFRPLVDYAKAKVIVSLDGDFLGEHPDAVNNARSWAQGRRVSRDHQTMSRVYVVDGGMSLTGANADVRIPLRPTEVAKAAMWLAGAVNGGAAESTLPAHVMTKLRQAAADLKSHRGACVVVAGRQQPAAVHMLAASMNEALGNVGATVRYTAMDETTAHVESLGDLVQRMNSGQVDTLVMLGGNPVYTAPADMDFAAALAKVDLTIHLSDYVDETSLLCDWHVNRAHYLESWGDGRSYDGTYTLQQPLILPLFDGRSVIEVLAALTFDDVSDGETIVRRTFDQLHGKAGLKGWRTALHNGFVEGSSAEAVSPSVNRSAVAEATRSISDGDGGGWQVVYHCDGKMYDGRFANNGWLQELPGAITKLTWDNAVLMSPGDAEQAGFGDNDVVSISDGTRTQNAAVLRVAGMPSRTVMVALGFGRRFEGRIASGSGSDFYQMRTSGAMWVISSATITRTNEQYPLACTQDHQAIDADSVGGKGQQNRLDQLVRGATLDHYQQHPDFAKHASHVVHRLSLWEEDFDYHRDGHAAPYAWGMSIDMNTCTGCSACVVACQAENNIPIVGKDQVLRGREMHWIRVDRYYKFRKTGPKQWDRDDLQSVALQPVMCMHCENAPCEQVCPVAATVHDQDGLNVMVYNRCIGTRYCSNNCPYKVRRFNYFDYHRRDAHREQPGVLLQVDPEYYTEKQADPGKLRELQFNPEVTVRMRGIMEKCTYCVQRITAARIKTKNAWVKQDEDVKRQAEPIRIPDGAITPACAQACPSQAIVFGDLNDRESRVAKLQRNERSYQMLEELNVKARTQYLAKVTNPGGAGDHSGQERGAGH